jgi:hypothetical protein
LSVDVLSYFNFQRFVCRRFVCRRFVCRRFEVVPKYINIIQSKALQNLPKLGFLVWKETIWQPCTQKIPEIATINHCSLATLKPYKKALAWHAWHVVIASSH